MSTNPFDSDDENEVSAPAKGNPFDPPEPELVAMESLSKLEAHWRTLEALITSNATDPFIVDDIQRKLTDIANTALDDESNSRLANQDHITPCMRYLMEQDVYERIVTFAQHEKNSVDLKSVVMKFVIRIISLTHQPLILHNQFLRPLLRLVEMCGSSKSNQLSQSTVNVLRYLWGQVRDNPSLVTLFNETLSGGDKSGGGHLDFPVFDILVDHIHKDGLLGGQCRETVFVILNICHSSHGRVLLDYVANKSVFAEVRPPQDGGW